MCFAGWLSLFQMMPGRGCSRLGAIFPDFLGGDDETEAAVHMRSMGAVLRIAVQTGCGVIRFGFYFRGHEVISCMVSAQSFLVF